MKIKENKRKLLWLSNKYNWHLQNIKWQFFYLTWPIIVLVNAFLYMWLGFFFHLMFSVQYFLSIKKKKRNKNSQTAHYFMFGYGKTSSTLDFYYWKHVDMNDIEIHIGANMLVVLATTKILSWIYVCNFNLFS